MLAKVKNNTTSESCIQTVKNESLSISPAEYELIVNAAALGILDVPAGTNADVYIRDYTDSKAGGTVIYSGTYGSYNFTASKEASKDSGSFTGGWSAHDFQACKR